MSWTRLALSLCLLSGPLLAAPSLGELMRAAADRNPGAELASAGRDIAAALQLKAQQPLADAPTANVKYQTDRFDNDLGYREWEGGVELPMWLPGQADSFAREAARQLDVANAMTADRELEVAGKVRERLWGAALARGDADQARSARDTAQELYNDIQRRVGAGELPRSDNLLAEKELQQREQALQEAQSRLEHAAYMFTRYTGFDVPLEPVAEVFAKSDTIDPSHPRLQLSHRTLERARAHRDRVGTTQRSGPNLWLGAKSARAAGDDDYEQSLGIELSMPFGASGHRAVELAEAEAALTQAQVEYDRTRLLLEDALTAARNELVRAAAALGRTERQRVLADESLELSRRAFQLGETDLVRLLQAQADALAARHAYQIRQLEHGQAIARLNQALGVIPK